MNVENLKSTLSKSHEKELLKLKLIQNDLKNNPQFISKQPKTKTSPKLTSPRINVNFNQLNEINREAFDNINISPKGEKKPLFLKKIKNQNNINDANKEPLSPKSLDKKQNKKPLENEVIIKNSDELINFTTTGKKNPLSILLTKKLGLLLLNETNSVSKELIFTTEKIYFQKAQEIIDKQFKNIDRDTLFYRPKKRQLRYEILSRNEIDIINDLNLQKIFKEKIKDFLKIIPDIKNFIEEHQLKLTNNFKKNIHQDLNECSQTFISVDELDRHSDAITPLISILEKIKFSKFVKNIIYLTFNPKVKKAKQIISFLRKEDRFLRMQTYVNCYFKENFKKNYKEKKELEILLCSKTEWDISQSLAESLLKLDNLQIVRAYLSGNTSEWQFKSFTINSFDMIKETEHLNKNNYECSNLQKEIFHHIVKKIKTIANPEIDPNQFNINLEIDLLFTLKNENNAFSFDSKEILGLCGISLWHFCYNLFSVQYAAFNDRNIFKPYHDDNTAGIHCAIQIDQEQFSVNVCRRYNFIAILEQKTVSFNIHFTINGALNSEEKPPKRYANMSFSDFNADQEIYFKTLKILTNPLPIEGVKYTIMSN